LLISSADLFLLVTWLGSDLAIGLPFSNASAFSFVASSGALDFPDAVDGELSVMNPPGTDVKNIFASQRTRLLLVVF
jgi:hypothetical protein